MKSKGQILQKLKQVRFRHLKKELTRFLKKAPTNCENHRLLGPDELGVCSLDCKVCDALLDDRAPECKDYSPRYEKEALKQSLDTFFNNRPVHEISIRFPDVAALSWTLQDEEELENIEPLTGQKFLQLFGIPLWTDTPEQLEILQEYLTLTQARSDALEALASKLHCDAGLESILLVIMEQDSHSKQLKGELERALSQLEKIKESNQAEERRRHETEREELLTTAPVKKKPWWRFWG